MNANTYNELRKGLAVGAMKGESAKAIDKMVAGYAKEDIQHYGKKREFINSGALAAANEAIAKAKNVAVHIEKPILSKEEHRNQKVQYFARVVDRKGNPQDIKIPKVLWDSIWWSTRYEIAKPKMQKILTKKLNQAAGCKVKT